MTGAALGDQFGRKRLFLVGLAVFAFAGVACAIAPSLGWLIAFRAARAVGGAVLAAVGLAAGVDAVAEAPTMGWSATSTVVLLAVGAATLDGVALRERRAAAPMILLELFRNRSFAAANMAFLCSAGAILSAAYIAPFVVAGAGVSLGFPSLPATADGTVAPTEVGPASGVVGTVQKVGVDVLRWKDEHVAELHGAGFEVPNAPYQRELHAHCYRIVCSAQDTEEALQDALITAWRHYEDFEGRSSARTGLYRIASNRCLDHLRARARTLARAPLEPDDQQGVNEK